MFEGIVQGIKQQWQKLAWSAGMSVGSYGALAYLLPVLLSVKVVALGGAAAVGYLAYTRLTKKDLDKALVEAKGDLERLKRLVS